MELSDDNLIKFEGEGAEPLPATPDQGYVEHDGVRVRCTRDPAAWRTRP
jgi:hypothetical protein